MQNYGANGSLSQCRPHRSNKKRTGAEAAFDAYGGDLENSEILFQFASITTNFPILWDLG